MQKWQQTEYQMIKKCTKNITGMSFGEEIKMVSYSSKTHNPSQWEKYKFKQIWGII